ncbi:TIGR00266 family protein [Magnetococcus sp. PR-3]|uniref:TIGR00266 family protein n=1 Tax=Magnetococcus sp. PR-3 TaxID=3120355 RepID=UPI002FCE3FFF
MAPWGRKAEGKQCHEVDYEIHGSDLQLVEVELDPNEAVIAEAGTMCYMEDGISFETKMGDGSQADEGFLGGLLSIGKRALTGESIFMTHFRNEGSGKKRVAFAAPFPGKVIPLDMSTLPDQTLYCQRDAFLCAALGTEVSIAFSRKLGAGFFGGEGFILQKLSGDGMAFIHAGGVIVEKKLEGGRLLVDTGCLVGFTPGIEYSIEAAGGMKSMIFGGEGIFLATLEGTGSVWLQSLPFANLADRILERMPPAE